MMTPLNFILALALIAAPLLAQNKSADTQREIAGYRTIHSAQASQRPSSVPVRYVFDEKRDWVKPPLRLALVPIEFSDKKRRQTHCVRVEITRLGRRAEYRPTQAPRRVAV